MNSRHLLTFLVLSAFAALIAALSLRLLPMLSFAGLQAHEHVLAAYGASHPLPVAAIFVIVYVLLAPLPLPAAELLTIAAGTLFGLVEGIALVFLAAAIGSCSAFLLGRFLARDLVRRHLSGGLAAVVHRIETEGAFYLFALHMVPVLPFFVINMAMGTTSFRLASFCWASQLGALPFIIAYVDAGCEIGRFDSLSAILSPGLLAAFAGLGLLPLGFRRLAPIMRQRFQSRLA